MLLTELFQKIDVLLPKELPEVNITHITPDSRTASGGSLFVCLCGAQSDGHKYDMNAYLAGCRVFLCQLEVSLPEDAIVIYVSNTRETLAKISATFYNKPSKDLKVIGITGTKGKTTTALMICGLLNACEKSCGYIGSNGIYYNNSSYKTENTTPESHILQKTLREMADSGVEYVALEVSSQALHTYRVEGIAFDCVVFTNLGRDHIGLHEHPTFEHYRDCKASLFTSKYQAAYCVCNTDDSMCEEITKGFKNKKIYYSMEGDADFTAGNIKYYQTTDGIGMAFDISDGSREYQSLLPIPGDFNVKNALCAFTVASLYVTDRELLSRAISSLRVDGRFEMYRTQKGPTFIIDYAHNGLSLGCALEELRKYCTGRLICLFGSVGDRTKERRKELGEAAGTYADVCIVTSDNPGYESPAKIINEIAYYVEQHHKECIKIEDREEAIRHAYSISAENDIILLAGKGHETYQLVEGKKVPFSEKLIVNSILSDEKKAPRIS